MIRSLFESEVPVCCRALGLLCIMLALPACRTESVPINLSFRDDKHLINTDRGRLLVLDTDMGCVELQNSIELGTLTASIPGTVVSEDHDICEFSSGFEIDGWPEGIFTVVFYGYNLDASRVSLWACGRQRLDSVSFTVGAAEGYDKDLPARCLTVAARCGGGCDVPVDP